MTKLPAPLVPDRASQLNFDAIQKRLDKLEGAPAGATLSEHMRLRLSANVNVGAGAVFQVPWNTEDADPGGWHVAGANAAFTPINTGIYLVLCQIIWLTNETGTRLVNLVETSGSAFVQGGDMRPATFASTTIGGHPLAWLGPLTGGQGYRIEVKHDQGVAIPIRGGAVGPAGSSGSFLSVVRLI